MREITLPGWLGWPLNVLARLVLFVVFCVVMTAASVAAAVLWICRGIEILLFD